MSVLAVVVSRLSVPAGAAVGQPTRARSDASQTFASALPVVILPLTILIYKERVSLRAVVGALIAVAGVAILFVK